jgi:hypothetical protein
MRWIFNFATPLQGSAIVVVGVGSRVSAHHGPGEATLTPSILVRESGLRGIIFQCVRIRELGARTLTPLILVRIQVPQPYTP